MFAGRDLPKFSQRCIGALAPLDGSVIEPCKNTPQALVGYAEVDRCWPNGPAYVRESARKQLDFTSRLLSL